MTVEPIGPYVPTHALELNGLDLIDGTGDEGWEIRALGSGQEVGEFTLGNPVAVITETLEQILDGSLASAESYDNREVTVPLLLSAPDGASLAAGEQALMEAARGTDGRGLLIWTSPAAAAEPSVFEVVYATADFEATDDWDIRERQDYGPQRGYMLTLVCKPFARSLDKVEIPGLPPSSAAAPIVIADGSSTTGWTSNAFVTNDHPVHHNFMSNPSFEVNLTGWTAGAGHSGAPTRVAGGANGAGFQMRGQAVASASIAYFNSPIVIPDPLDVGYIIAAQQRWDGTVSSGSAPTSAVAGILVRVFDAQDIRLANLYLGERALPRNTYGNAAVRVDLSEYPTAASMRVYPYVKRPNFKASASNPSWSTYLDQVIVTEETGAGQIDAAPYFDGATTNLAHATYAWDGTAGLSTSTVTYDPQTLTSDGDSVTATWYGAKHMLLKFADPFVVPSSNPFIRMSGSFAWNDANGQRTDDVNFLFKINDSIQTPAVFTKSNGTWSASVFHVGEVSELEVEIFAPDAAYKHGVSLSIDDVVLSSAPAEGTGRQLSRVIPVHGSMRTEADINITSIEAGSNVPLGNQALVYTVPARSGIASPNMRQWRTAGGVVTADTGSISGATENVPVTSADAVTFMIPADQVRKGTHALWASLNMSVSGIKRLHWSATVSTVYSTHTETGDGDVFLNGVYTIVPLGHVTLPPSDIDPQASATITLKLWADGSTSGAVRLDEAWVFNVDDGQVSLVDVSGGVSMLRLSSATIENPNPSCWIGDADSTINTIHAGARAQFDQHLFAPGDLMVFTVATSSSKMSAAASYYRRAHTYPAPLPGMETMSEEGA